ncbi:MAG: RNA polymerase sigma factor SigZ [Pirellulaceae bacterium]
MATTTEAVWSKLSADLRRFIRRRVADDHAADDLLQETFLRVHKNIDRLRKADRLAAWVYQIARNVIHDHHRSRTTEPLADVDPIAESDERSQWLSGAERWLDELIGQLPNPYQQAVRMSEIDGLRQREVAERLGLAESGAKSRIQRGRAMLKEALDKCCVFHFDQRGNLVDCDPKSERTVCRDCDA